MAQLIALGNVIVNLDRISILDIDPVANRPDLRKVRIISGGSTTEVFTSPATEVALLNLVEANRRFPGTDAVE